MATRLTPCPSCSRHVKVGPPSCPFCGGDVPTVMPERTTPVRWSRRRMTAVVVASAATLGACSSSTEGGTIATTDASDVMDRGGEGDAAYGAFEDDADLGGEDDAAYGGFDDAGDDTQDDGGSVVGDATTTSDGGQHK